MAPGDFTTARRVDAREDLTQAGDYALGTLIRDGVSCKQIWFLLPTHKGSDMFDRADEHSGLHGIGEPVWTVTEHEDGSVSAQPSIGCGAQPYYWHGYLDPGNVWREV